MTPFAALGQLEKNANQYLVDAASPYTPQTGYALMKSAHPGATPAPPARSGELSNTWADLGVSLIPGVGSVYMGNKAVNDFKEGNWGSGLGNLGWAALGLIPGAGLLRGGLGAVKAGLKGRHIARAAIGGARKALPMKPMLAGSAAALAAPLLDPSKPQPQPQPQQQSYGGSGLMDYMAGGAFGYTPDRTPPMGGGGATPQPQPPYSGHDRQGEVRNFLLPRYDQ